MKKITFSFTTMFKPINKGFEFLQKPLNSRYQAKQVVKQYSNQLTNEQITNLLQSLQYFSPNEVISILKKSITLKQVFGKEEFTNYFLKSDLDSVHKANLILLCYKYNLHDDVWIKCMSMIVEDLSPYYLSETMWALKNKQFESQDIQKMACDLQLRIIEQIPQKLDQFDFYCLSLMLQSLTTEYKLNFTTLAERFFMIADGKDHFPLCYGLYAIAKMKSHLSSQLKNYSIVNIVEKCMPYLKQTELLLSLWALQKLEYGDEKFWMNAYTFLQSQKIQSLQSIAMQSQIISQLFNFDDQLWSKIEKKVIQFIKSDEKSLVTIFQTFSINKKGSPEFWNKLTEKILEDVKIYKIESVIKLATHSEIPEFSSQLPINWNKLTTSQQCLIINKFSRLGLDMQDKFTLIKKNISNLIGKDLSLILYTIHKYYPTMPLDDYFDQLSKTVHLLNQMDFEQLLQLQWIPQDIKDLLLRQQQKLQQQN